MRLIVLVAVAAWAGASEGETPDTVVAWIKDQYPKSLDSSIAAHEAEAKLRLQVSEAFGTEGPEGWGDNVTIFKVHSPHKTVNGREACGSRDVIKSWKNIHYIFPVIFGGMREGRCEAKGYSHYEGQEVVKDPPIPFPVHHMLTWDIWSTQQPPGVSDPIYNCTYTSGATAATSLTITINGTRVACGQPRVFTTTEVGVQPAVAFLGAQADTLYTVLLLNPNDDIPVGPIFHHGAGNIRGSDLASGSFGNATTIRDYYHPNPPIPLLRSDYVYMVFEQTSTVDFTDVKAADEKAGHIKFPVKDVMKQKHLRLLQTNYFLARRPLTSMSVPPIVV